MGIVYTTACGITDAMLQNVATSYSYACDCNTRSHFTSAVLSCFTSTSKSSSLSTTSVFATSTAEPVLLSRG
ncbi:hypothetical protein EB796_006659 [Bugula neritina]|uniref:Uncharacterized protein n=1 Tax=Bugula neritina TaxID=10212 RepID=A0A7J7K9Y4_BUGNE|nr:hypothetical protein EB796_006659 [Bugula neritina]